MMLLIRILILSVFVVAKVFGKMDCAKERYHLCEIPKMLLEIPRDISEFTVSCPEVIEYIRCLKEYQDSCEIEIFRAPGVYEAHLEAFSTLCEEGTLLNAAVTENLKCFNDTLNSTNCLVEMTDIMQPYWRHHSGRPGVTDRYPVDLQCLSQVLIYDCVRDAVLVNCGEKAEEAIQDLSRRAKHLENNCDVEGAKSVIRKIDDFNMEEDKRNSVVQCLEQLAEQNSDIEHTNDLPQK